MRCERFACLMSVEACEANQRQAIRAITKVETQEALTDQEMSRMIVCGDCEKMNGTQARAKAALHSLFDDLFAKIDRYDEWGNDPELMALRKKAKYKRKRIRHEHEIKVKGRIYRIEKRMEQLRRRHGKDNETVDKGPHQRGGEETGN